VQTLIRQQGAVVMTTGRHTYDRFVHTGAACDRSTVAWQTTVNTRDGAQCPVYNCVNESAVRPMIFDRFP
jgi:hypothetical protein